MTAVVGSTPALAASRPSARGSLAECVATPAARRAVYGRLAAGIFLIACLMQGIKSARSHEAFDLVVSDAEGFWVYLPSVVIDGNLDFKKSIDLHTTVHPIEEGSFPEAGGKLQNHWPSGVAITLAPAFIAAHACSLLAFRATGFALFAPNGYSILYQLFCLAFVVAWALVGLIAADDFLVRHFVRLGMPVGGFAIAAGTIGCLVGSSFFYYVVREPFMAHAIAATWIILLANAVERAVSALRDGRTPALAIAGAIFCGSIAFASRYTNLCLFPVEVYLLIEILRSNHRQRLLRWLPLFILSAAPAIAQLLVLRMLGHRHVALAVQTSALGYRRSEGFRWVHPALWQTLFSPRHGLFFWAPLLLAAIWGLGWYFNKRTGRRDGLLVSLVLSAIILWYLNSAWYAWWFGKSFGARAFVDLSIVFAVGLALAFQSVSSWLTRPGAAAVIWSAAICAASVNWLLMALFIGQKIPREHSIFWKQEAGHAHVSP